MSDPMSTSGGVPLEARLAARARPRGLTRMRQRWSDLLFLHWRLEPEIIQRSLPEGLRVDTYDGSAWVGVVPFSMSGIRPPFLPPLPGISSFLELNLRTYAIDAEGVPGVWFYSLEANQTLAVKVARTLFHLPYFRADMALVRNPATKLIDYAWHRRGSDESLSSHFRFGLADSGNRAEPGTLEFFLVERYVLFAQRQRDGALFRGRVHHDPYRVVTAEVPVQDAHLFVLDGLPEPKGPPDHVCGALPVDVSIFGLEPMGR